MPTTDERLASLEARVEAMSDVRGFAELRADTNGRFTELRADMNSRFTELRVDMDGRSTELRADMNGRFDDVNRRVAVLDQKGDRHFTWLVGKQVAVLLAIVGALLGVYYR